MLGLDRISGCCAARVWCALQVAMEVHDVDNGLQRAIVFLRDVAKFDSVMVEQDPALQCSSLYNIFCTRNQHD